MPDSPATAPGQTPAPPPRAELPKQYKPTDHEPRIREKWESSGAFHPDPERVLRGESKPYCIVIPPPNVTDRLHLGHALNNTLQDVLIRAHRMMGYETLWMPGTDHAGIATQAVVEKRLRKEGKLKGPLRESMKREDFIAIVQSFKDEYEATITGQLKAMGCSCDWQRQRFTMDEQCAAAVYEAFFRFFKDGLIYRGKRLVNWDPILQTAVADDECYEEEIDSQFYYLRYPLVHALGTPPLRGGSDSHAPERRGTHDAVPVTWSELRALGWPAAEDADHADDKQAWVTVATTRPETYLGDTAVAVNPRDPRAKSLRGLNVELPLIGRIIPIIEDDYVVLPAAMQSDPDEAAKDPKAKYATGFLKVTPAHDPNDYEIGVRHNLHRINIFAPDATISDKHGWSDATELKGAHKLLGLKREDARKLVIKEFEAHTVGGEGTTPLFAKSLPYRHSVKHSDRSKAVIEPYLSDQWYVKVTDPRLKGAALAAMSQGGAGQMQGGAGLRPAAEVQLPPLPPGARPFEGGMPVTDNLRINIRRLPHFQKGGSTYFITFRLAQGTMSPAEREIVLAAVKHWHRQRMYLHAVTIMPDHVHLLMKPMQRADGAYHPLGELMHSIKSFSAHQINKLRGKSGQVWQDEWFDRIMPDHKEWEEKLHYIQNNPVKAGLAERPGDYPFTFIPNDAHLYASDPEGIQGGAGLRPAAELALGGAGLPPAAELALGGAGLRPAARPASAHEQPLIDSRHSAASDGGPEARPTSAGEGDLTFYPSRYAKTFELWHENIRDWCISRQLWWGHRIPVWSRLEQGFESLPALYSPARQPMDLWPTANAKWQQSGRIAVYWDRFGRHPTLGVEAPAREDDRVYVCIADPNDREIVETLNQWGFTRDPDVLDTWFSSGLWPISTMGWPSDTDLLRAFNPSSTLCTAREIITLWVSRMVMFNRYLMPESWPSELPLPEGGGRGVGSLSSESLAEGGAGRGPLPFRDVFIHALIMDGAGQKMSKSLGNGVDPLDIIESHGADAMRFVLCQMTTQTQDVRMPVNKGPNGKNTSPKFDIGRNFCNKLWNASRFALTMLEQPNSEVSRSPLPTPHSLLSALPDRWILSRLAASVQQINTALANYEYSDYATALYDLMWRDFCDWYIEAIKPTIATNKHQRAVLAHTLESIVRLLHPITPFITEAIWERLKEVETDPINGIDLAAARKGGLLATAGWPIVAASLRDEAAERQFERLRNLTTAIREVRAQHNIPPKRRITLHTPTAFSPEETSLIETLAGIDKITTDKAPADSAAFTFEGAGEGGGELRLSNLADAVDASAEKARLEKAIADADKTIATLQGRLNNPGYTDRAPPVMVEQTKSQLAKAQSDRQAAASALAKL